MISQMLQDISQLPFLLYQLKRVSQKLTTSTKFFFIINKFLPSLKRLTTSESHSFSRSMNRSMTPLSPTKLSLNVNLPYFCTLQMSMESIIIGFRSIIGTSSQKMNNNIHILPLFCHFQFLFISFCTRQYGSI